MIEITVYGIYTEMRSVRGIRNEIMTGTLQVKQLHKGSTIHRILSLENRHRFQDVLIMTCRNNRTEV
jgi:hypothetical protein